MTTRAATLVSGFAVLVLVLGLAGRVSAGDEPRPGAGAGPPASAPAPSAAPAAPAGGEYVPGGDADHPKVRYADGSVSENDRCIVRKAKLNPQNRPVFVNGRAIGFC